VNNRPPPPPQGRSAAAKPPPPNLDQFRDPNWGAEKLKSIGLMKRFTNEELSLLYAEGEFKTIMPQSYAVIEGEPSRGLFVLLKGTVSVYKNDITGSSMHRIAILEEGAFFGELSLFDKHPRTATVAAESVCQMFYLDAERFERFLEDRGSDAKIRFYRQCAEELAQRFRILNSDYINSQQLLWKYALRKSDESAQPTDEQSAEAKSEDEL
jgi:CRP-like cAMP-binding protein